MSMNICIQTNYGAEFDAWQTPSAVTYDILGSSDPLQAYIDWVLSVSFDQYMPRYTDTDMWGVGVGDPVEYVLYNEGKDHVEGLKSWVSWVQLQGQVITFEAV